MKQKYHHCTIWYGHFSIISLLSSLMNTSGAFPGSLTLVQTVYYIFFLLEWYLLMMFELFTQITGSYNDYYRDALRFLGCVEVSAMKSMFKFLLHCSCSRCVQSTSFVESDTQYSIMVLYKLCVSVYRNVNSCLTRQSLSSSQLDSYFYFYYLINIFYMAP